MRPRTRDAESCREEVRQSAGSSHAHICICGHASLSMCRRRRSQSRSGIRTQSHQTDGSTRQIATQTATAGAAAVVSAVPAAAASHGGSQRRSTDAFAHSQGFIRGRADSPVRQLALALLHAARHTLRTGAHTGPSSALRRIHERAACRTDGYHAADTRGARNAVLWSRTIRTARCWGSAGITRRNCSTLLRLRFLCDCKHDEPRGCLRSPNDWRRRPHPGRRQAWIELRVHPLPGVVHLVVPGWCICLCDAGGIEGCGEGEQA